MSAWSVDERKSNCLSSVYHHSIILAEIEILNNLKLLK